MRRPRLPRYSIPLLSYALLWIISFYPQSLRPWDTVAYIGDSLESVWTIAWIGRQLFRDPLHLFDSNVLYPNPNSLAFDEHAIFQSLLVAPVLWATKNPVLAYNVALALGCLLAAMAARQLALSLGLDSVGSWAAGALYAFHTYQVNEGPRIQLIYHGFLPLAFGALVLYLKNGRPRYAWILAGLMLLEGLSSNYHLLYGSLMVAVFTLVALVLRPAVTLRRLPVLALASITAAVAFSPVTWQYLDKASVHGYFHELPSGVDLEHYFSTSRTNIVYGPLGAEVRLQQNAAHFIGFVSLALALVAMGAWGCRRGQESPNALLPSRLWVPAAAALALGLVLLSLGKDMVVFGTNLGPGPYRLLYYGVPGFKLVRIPERLSLMAMLFISLLVGRALTLLRASRLKPITIPLTAMLLLEHVSPLPHTDRIPVGDEVPAVYSWLAQAPVQALAEIPIHGEALIRKESLDMYFSAYHLKPIIHGYATYEPLITRLLRKLAARFPSEGSLQAFQRVGVDTVVFHHGRTGAEKLYELIRQRVREGRLVLEKSFTGEAAHVYLGSKDEVYRIVPVSPMRAAPFPKGRRLTSPEWRYRSNVGNPDLAADGDLYTDWRVTDPLNGDEFLQVMFDRPVRVSGVVLRLRRDTQFPDRFRIVGRDPLGRRIRWSYDAAHALQLLDRLQADPRQAAIGFDFGGVELTSILLRASEDAESFSGWFVPEFEVWVR